jgi:HAE1 family hydrophobic/amphiphilic exporter-1
VVVQSGAGPNGPGSPVLLHDVASVDYGYKKVFQLQRLNGQDAVGLSVTKASDANAIQVADDVRKELDRLTPLLPQGTRVAVTNDTSLFTRAALDSIQRDVGLAVLLVAAVVLVFLHEWKHTAIVLCAIPTSLISTFLGMYLLGFTLNIMSLMALALMIGILVDDSIVVLENIHRHLQLGETPWQAAINGRSEIGLAAIAITAADIVVYTPIAFMSGTVGQLFRQYGLTIVMATLLSLIVSFTLTPMLASRWVTHDSDHPGPIARFGRWWDARFNRLSSFVGRSVPVTIRLRWLVVLLSLALVAAVGSMIPLRILSTEFSPQEDDNNFEINMTTPPGTSLDTTDQVARQMEAILQRIPEVQDSFTSVSIPGGSGGFFFGGRSGGRVNIDVQLPPKDQRKRSVFEVIDQVRAAARQIPGATFTASVSSPLAGGGGFGAIGLQIRGPDLDTLSQLADQVQQVTRGIPGLADIQNTSLAASPDVEVVLDHARMAQLGITAQQVSTALRTVVGGSVVSELRPSGKPQVDITLIAADADRANLANLASIPVATVTGSGTTTPGSSTVLTTQPPGSLVTLGQIATIRPSLGPVSIQRVDRNRSVTLNALATGRPLGDVASDVRKAVQQIPLPPGYSINYGGQVQQLNTALAALGAALVLSLILEYMLLVALYESWLFPLVRMLTIPLGLVGALLLLLVTGNTINVVSIIGMIMAEGLVAKSGILLVDYANTLRERGLGRTEALAQAASVRLRPILMTSATMIFGMLPLALKLEPGAESRAPMAVVVIGGLISSTLLTLVVVPALYTMFDDLQNRFGRRRAAPALERAVPAPVPAGNGADGARTPEPAHRRPT